MKDEIENKIIDRLKTEGNLTRNTGVNSIKSIRLDLKKFENLFQSINENIIQQTQLLRASLEIQMEEARIRKSISELSKAEKTTVEQDQKSYNRNSSKLNNDIKFSEDQKAAGFLTSLAALFGIGTVGGATGAAIGSSLLAALRAPLKTALFTVIAPVIGATLGSITQSALLEIGTDRENASRFAEAANLAGLWGLIGLAFGRRLGLIGAAAGAAASFADDVLDAIGLDRNQMITILGQEMRLETLTRGIMGVLGASIASAVSSQAFRQTIVSFFSDAVGPNGEIISRLNRRRALITSIISSAVLAAYIRYADDIKGWLEEQGLPENVANGIDNIAQYTINGATLLSMFGPKGAIVGAALGFAIGLGTNIIDWLNRIRNSATESFHEQINEVSDIIRRANSGETISEEERRKLVEHRSEALRRTELVLPEREIQTAREQLQIMDNFFGSEPLDPDQGINDLQLETRLQTILDALENNNLESNQNAQNAIRELRDYASRRSNENEYTRDQILLGMAQSVFGFRTFDQYLHLIDELKDALIPDDSNIEESSQNPTIQPIENPFPQSWPNEFSVSSYSKGSKGFENFGKGTLAILHGREAVVPETTSAGQFLRNYFDENWQPLQNKVIEVAEATKTLMNTTNIVYAPMTISPINQINRGGDSQVQMNAFGGNSRSDLDLMSRPLAVQ